MLILQLTEQGNLEKSTIINALETRLRKEYLVISISLEAADDYFASMQTFVNGLVMDIADELRNCKEITYAP